jgi:hypothetical protein
MANDREQMTLEPPHPESSSGGHPPALHMTIKDLAKHLAAGQRWNRSTSGGGVDRDGSEPGEAFGHGV